MLEFEIDIEDQYNLQKLKLLVKPNVAAVKNAKLLFDSLCDYVCVCVGCSSCPDCSFHAQHSTILDHVAHYSQNFSGNFVALLNGYILRRCQRCCSLWNNN